MGTIVSALWQGLIAGALARAGPAPVRPRFAGFLASVADTLYELGFTVGSIVAYGRQR